METKAGWCILRTTGCRTIRLAASLLAAGIEAWTPSQVQRRRRPRSKVEVDRDVPIVPTFVFADADRLEELLAMARRTSIEYPPFSLFRFSGRIPVIAEGDIAALRAEEDRQKRAVLKRYRFDIKKGSIVRAKDGPWAGLEGVVEDTRGKFAVVLFNGRTVKVASWLLEPNELKAA